MKFASTLVSLLLASDAMAQNSVACIWSGNLANCLPAAGLLLSNQRDLRLGEASANGSDYAAIQAPSSFTTYTLTLPTTDGGANEFLQTDGSGVLTWNLPNYISTGGGGYALVSAALRCQATSSVLRQTGSWVSIGNISSGECVLTMTGFTASPMCTLTYQNSAPAAITMVVDIQSNAAMTIGCYNDAGAANCSSFDAHVICIGSR